jgi:hypothetical protein
MRVAQVASVRVLRQAEVRYPGGAQFDGFSERRRFALELVHAIAYQAGIRPEP